MTNIPYYIPTGNEQELGKKIESWIGQKVRRGPTWQWGSQDYHQGRSGEGKVISLYRISTEKEILTTWLNVQWKNGDWNQYRVGNSYADIILVDMKELPTSFLNLDQRCEICGEYKCMCSLLL